jgi:hypothetical protein
MGRKSNLAKLGQIAAKQGFLREKFHLSKMTGRLG